MRSNYFFNKKYQGQYQGSFLLLDYQLIWEMDEQTHSNTEKFNITKLEPNQNYKNNKCQKNLSNVQTKIEAVDPEQLYYMNEYTDAHYGNDNEQQYQQSNTYANMNYSSEMPSYSKLQDQNSNLQQQYDSNEIQFEGYDPIKKKMIKILRKPTRINMDRNAYETMMQMFKIYDKKQYQLKSLTFSKISSAIGYNQAVISHYYQQYRNRIDGGYRRVRKPMLRHIPIDNSVYGSSNIRLQRLAVLQQIIIKNPYLTRKQLRDEVNKYDHLKPPNKQVSTTMVSQVLNQAGYRQKRCFISAFDRNTTQILQLRKQYCQKIKSLRQKNQKIYFFDYNQFNIYNIRQKMWYNKKTFARELQVSDFLAGDENLVFLAIMNDEGLAECEIQYKSSIAKSIIGYFQILVKKMKLVQNQNIINYVFMDEEKFPEKVLKYLIENVHSLKIFNIKLQLLPPKSALMNPIENWFHIIKNRVSNKNFNKNAQLKCEFLKQLTKVQKQQMKENFVKTESFLEKGIKKQPF